MPGGSKRKRKASPASSSNEDSKPAAAARRKSDGEPSFLSTLLDVVKKLYQSTDLASASTLILSNKAWALDGSAPGKDEAPLEKLPAEQAFCYAIVLVTHVLYRLTSAAAEGVPDKNAVQALAGWSRLLQHTLMNQLVPSCSKWDKATGPARHLFARAIAAVTGASITSLTSDPTDTMSLLAATVTLEEALLNLGTCPPLYAQSEDFATDACEADIEEWPLAENPTKMQEAASKANKVIVESVRPSSTSESTPFWETFAEANAQVEICEWTTTEWACLKSLDLENIEDTCKPKKRGTRRQVEDVRGTWDAFAKENKLSQTPLDGRLTARRWAAVMMDWHLHAGPRLLAKAEALLSADSELLEDLKDSDGWSVKGKVLSILLVGRWGRILAESSSRSGFRIPIVGGFDSYIRPLLPAAFRTKGKQLTPKKMTKPDTRDITMVAIHSLLETHADCLKSSDDEDLPYCFWVPDIIHDLATAAAASGGLSGSESSECIDRIENAAAAYIPSIFDGSNNDWILRFFGISKFHHLLCGATEEETASTLFESNMVEAAGPLPTPTTLMSKPVSKKKKSDAAKNLCGYAGVYPREGSGRACVEKIALHVRGYGMQLKAKQSKGTKSVNPRTSELMINHWFALADEAIDVSGRQPAGKTRTARTSSTHRPSKRRRKDKEMPSEVLKLESDTKKDEKRETKSILSVVRAKLASKLLRVMDSFVMPKSGSVLRKIMPSIDDIVMTRAAVLLIDFSMSTYNVLFAERSWADIKLSDISSVVGTDGSGIPCGAKIIADHESELWSNLISATATLGSGRQDNLSMESRNETIFAGNRLDLYKHVASQMAKEFGRECWPLWLPTPLRVFVSCNLCAENMSGSQDFSADRFILNGSIATLDEVLKNPLQYLKEDTNDSPHPCVEETVSLSLYDARLIVGACARLTDAEQVAFVDRLLGIINMRLRDYVEGSLSGLVQQERTASFIARVVTMAAHATTLVGCAADYRRCIQRSLCDSFSRRLNAWASTDKHIPHVSFMSICSNWESTDLPEGVRPKENVPESLFTKFHETIQTSFTLGFNSSTSDHGHLLYAAWNAHGKSSLWNPAKDQLSIPSISLENAPSAILAIRNDLCLVHRRVRSDQGIMAKSSISKSLDRSLGAGSPRTIVDNLKTLVEKGSEHIHTLLDSTGRTENPLPSMSICGLLESLSIAVSFGISFLTVTDSSFFSELMSKHAQINRPRGYSTDSDHVDSDGDSTCSNDARVNASERLAEVCRAFGAVPAHPDWLDSNCSLRYGITRAEARGLAITALRALTRLVKTGVAKRKDNIGHVIESCGLDSVSSKLFVESTSLLNSLSGSSESARSEATLKTIAVLCGVEEGKSKSLVSGLGMGLQTAANDYWCTNASQQIIGEMHNLVQSQLILPSEVGTSELRATGDWEIALATSLLCGLFDVESSTDFHVLSSSRWAKLTQSALEWMVPACALLHFSLQTSGRLHPLKSLNCSIDEYTASAQHFMDFANPTMRLTGNQRDSTMETLEIICSPVTSKEKATHAIASHLVGSPREYRFLMHVGRAVLAVQVLTKLLERPIRSVESENSSLRNLLSSIVDNLKSGDGNATEWPLARLIAACAHNAVVEINTSTLGKLKMNDTIPSEMNSWCDEKLDPETAGATFVSSAISALCGLLSRPTLAALSTLEFVASTLASLSIVEREIKVDKKLNRLISQSIVEGPERLFDCLKFHEDTELFDRLALYLSNLCGAPFVADASGSLSTYAGVLFGLLVDYSNAHRGKKSSHGLLNLWFLCGTYTGGLGDIGESLFDSDLLCLENANAAHNYIRYLSSLAASLSKVPSDLPASKTDTNAEEKQLCSFVIKEGFQEQHWYNCRTCELTGEKGCCSMCVRVCHNGHDVVYARFSSFFCDCGAETAKSREDSSSFKNCLCLLPSEDQVVVLPEVKPFVASGTSETVSHARIAATFFKEKSQTAMKKVKTTVARNRWVQKISEAVTMAVDHWKEASVESDRKSMQRISIDEFSSPSEMDCAELDDYKIVNSSRPGVFDTLSLSDEPIHNRSLLAADSRGRLLVCEGARLRFLEVGCMMDNSFASDRLDFQRSDIPLFGSVAHDIKDIVGMQISIQNEQHLLLWSQVDVLVFVLKHSWNGVLKRVQCTPEEQNTTSKIIKCVWLPGAEGYIMVGSGNSVRILKISEEQMCSVALFSLEENSMGCIKDSVLVPKRKGYATIGWTVFLLLERGSLHKFYIPCDDVFAEGMSKKPIDVGESTAVTKAIEEDKGERLDYLEGGGILICQTIKSGVVAMQLKEWYVQKSSVLIPPKPTLKTVFSDTVIELEGPFTNWHALKHGSGDGPLVLRLCCAAKVKDSANSIVLHLLFEKSLSYKVSNVLKGLPEGSVLCSLPCTEGDDAPYDLRTQKTLVERDVIAFLTSNGAFTSFIEVGPDYNAALCQRGEFPVTAFEGMLKVSLPESLCFQVDGISDDIGARVLRDNDEFLVSPRPEGFTMNISFKKPAKSEEQSLVISGVRIHVGKTSVIRIPTSIFVEGRKITLKKGVSDWYAAVLTAEEVARTTRKGFLTIKVDTSHVSGNTPVVDSIEVYGMKRSIMAKWLNPLNTKSHVLMCPAELQQMNHLLLCVTSLRDLKCIGNDKAKGNGSVSQDFLHKLVRETAIGCSKDLSKAVVGMVEIFEGDLEDSSQAFLDQTRVKACLDFVSEAAKIDDWGPTDAGEAEFHRGERFMSRLEDCLRLSCDIAKNRPGGYLKSMESKDGTLGSIALPASVLLENESLRHIVTDEAVTQLTELCLIEMAIAGGSAIQGINIDHFAALQRLLQSQTGRILSATCRSVNKFCSRFQLQELLGDEADPFAAQYAAFYGCDSCSLFPIKGTRYTLANSQHSFDLCQDCYEKASKFASSNRFRKGRDVVVDGKTIGNDNTKLSCNEVKMMKAFSHERSVTGGEEVVHRQQVYDEFLGNLFVSIMGLFPSEIESKGYIETDVVQLAADLVNLSERSCMSERKKRLAKKVVESLSRFIEVYHVGLRQQQSVVSCINALSQLVVPDRDARMYFSTAHTSTIETPVVRKGSADAQCETHHCSLEVRVMKGEEGKKFVTCKSDRCGLFSWLKEDIEDALGNLKRVLDNEAAANIWTLLSEASGKSSLLEELSVLVENSSSSGDFSFKDTSRFYPYTQEKAQRDLEDGVLCGQLKTGKVSFSQFLQRMHTLPCEGEKNADPPLLVDVCMQLLSLTAPAKEKHAPGWHRLLCGMITTEKSLSRKNLAKSTLFRLCGSDNETYHGVRDQFAMSFQLQKLAEHSESLLQQGVLVRRKSHMCGKNWRTPVESSTSKTNGLEFLGISDLLPEGTLSVGDCQAVKTSLEELLSIAKRRNKNWQVFALCPTEKVEYKDLSMQPLSLVLSVALLLDGDCQLKAMKLCELASAPPDSQKQGRRQNAEERLDNSGLPLGSLSASEATLAFSTQFILNGRAPELRRIACSIANQILRRAGPGVVREVFPKLMIILEKGAGERGRNAVEFVALLTSVAQHLADDVLLADHADTVQIYWLKQMHTLRHHRANEEILTCETRSNVSQRKRFDLGFCVHCSRHHTSAISSNKRSELPERPTKGSTAGRSGDASSRKSARGGVSGQNDSGKLDWIEGQVSPASRTHIRKHTQNSVNDEFSTYIELKNRLVISEIHLEIHDPRGRFVKTITVYWAPRPVSETRELTSAKFQPRWEKFGVMQLARGTSRCSITLTKPIIAANLKFEYTDFHERPGDSRQPDNGFVIHCPRCSRIVQNAHGVCGICGEVAFQCRKCRHINYDRLDALFCVECGYSAFGTFSYEIVAAIASNAVAITNDNEYVKFKKMLSACARFRDDIRTILKDRFSSLTKSSKKTEKESDWGSEDLRRAYTGLTPLIQWQKGDSAHVSLQTLGKQGSVVRAVARPQNLDVAGRGSTDRSCTIHALSHSAFSMSNTSSGSERRHSEDIVVQQIRAEIDEDESEILGLLEGSGRAGVLDSSDPISRLLARVRSRHEQSENDRQEDGAAASPVHASSGKAKGITAKECLELCEQLHILMREAEREAYELQRRIQAWDRLNRDDLADLEFSRDSMGYVPCRCWNCSSTVASCLLSLWQRLFQANPLRVSPSKEVVEVLLQNEASLTSSSHRGLHDCKRVVVESIATLSESGARMVLEGLRRRFAAGQDVYAAEILGRILESSTAGPLQADFVKLAEEQVERLQLSALSAFR